MSKYQWIAVLSLVGAALIGAAYVVMADTELVPPTPAVLGEATSLPSVATLPAPIPAYVRITDSCDHEYVGDCVRVRSGPGPEYEVVQRLRNGVVLSVASATTTDGVLWYKIGFVHPLIYPERVRGGWYVAADVVQAADTAGDSLLTKESATTTKRITVDISSATLSAYDGDVLFMEVPISTGLEFTPTPRGTFTVFKMTPSRFMQGPIPGVSDQVYDLPGVPWNLYFTQSGAVIHGAYWHNSFGRPWSHGCVNLSVENAEKLYHWAVVGIQVTVRN